MEKHQGGITTVGSSSHAIRCIPGQIKLAADARTRSADNDAATVSSAIGQRDREETGAGVLRSCRVSAQTILTAFERDKRIGNEIGLEDQVGLHDKIQLWGIRNRN